MGEVIYPRTRIIGEENIEKNIILVQALNRWERILSGEVFKAGCSKCENGRIKIYKKPPAVGWYSAACECLLETEHLKNVLELLKESNLPWGYLKYNPLKMLNDNPQKLLNKILTAEALNKISDTVVDKNWVYFSGSAGVGKTYAAIALAQLFLLREKSVYFANMAKLLDDLRPDGVEGMKEKILKVEVLIIDDIGKEKLSVWAKERLFIIINERHAWDLRTIFTSNESVVELFKNTQPAIYSRVASKSILLEFINCDKRLT